LIKLTPKSIIGLIISPYHRRLAMPQLKPETALRKKLEALERQKTMLDAMGSFLKAHPQTASECSIHQLHGKLGLKFGEHALVVPYQKKSGGTVLKLFKSGEDWYNNFDADELYGKRVVSEDVNWMTDEQLKELLDKVYREANPEEDEE
jgi:hypothetical protein